MQQTSVTPTASADVRPLCRRWFQEECQVEPLAATGFSGSPLFLVKTASGMHVLKAFAAGTSPGRVRFVHALMRHLCARGIGEVPAVADTRDGESFAVDGRRRLWEMQVFVDGVPALDPSPRQAASAVALLARVHAAAAAMPENPPDVGPSPAIIRRIDQARAWLARPWPTATRGGGKPPEPLGDLLRPRLRAAADAIAAADGEQILRQIAAIAPEPLPRQSVVRDVWAAHVLFASARSARIVGLIDFHAAATDTPATDLARLLGSWMTVEAVDPAWWPERLAAYGTTPLGPQPVRLVAFLAASGVLFGLDNWFRWIFEKRLAFASPTAVAGRVDRLLEALPTALAVLANGGKLPV